MITLEEIIDNYNIKYFTLSEITKGRDVPLILHKNIIHTLLFVNEMRVKLGFPMTFTSTYRNIEYNKLVGGAINSMHLVFNAMDIVPVTGRREQLKEMHDYCDKNRDECFYKMGIGYYPSFIHVDTRGLFDKRAATWGDKLCL